MTAFAKDKQPDYQIGTFVLATANADGTTTSTLHGDGTTVAGGVYGNYLKTYQIKGDTGTWTVVPLNEAQDSMIRGMGMTPTHFKKEKDNPLDVLKSGDKVMFRLYEHHYVNGKRTEMAIPYADNPNKEFKFVTSFVPKVPVPAPDKPTDNVKAMCNSGKLTADQQKQFCTQQQPDTAATSTPQPQPQTPQPSTTAASPMDQFKAMCDSAMFKPGRDDVAIQQCNITFPKK